MYTHKLCLSNSSFAAVTDAHKDKLFYLQNFGFRIGGPIAAVIFDHKIIIFAFHNRFSLRFSSFYLKSIVDPNYFYTSISIVAEKKIRKPLVIFWLLELIKKISSEFTFACLPTPASQAKYEEESKEFEANGQG